MNTREMFKSWSLKGNSKLFSAWAFLVKPMLSKKSLVVGEATPEAELTATGADSGLRASRELNMSENDMAAVSGGASSPGHHPEPSTRPASVGRARLNQFGGTRDGRRYLPNRTMSGSSSNRVSGGQLRMPDAGAGLECELRLTNLPLGATQSLVGIVVQDEESTPDLESQLGSNVDGDAPVSGEDSDAPVSGVRAHLNFRVLLQPPYILFGLKTNATLCIINVHLILDLKLPGSAPTLPEGVLAAAAGIGLLASAFSIYLQVKNRRSGPAKVLSQISVISLVCSILVNLSTRFLFEKYMPVNIVTTAVLFVFVVGLVIWAGISTAVL